MIATCDCGKCERLKHPQNTEDDREVRVRFRFRFRVRAGVRVGVRVRVRVRVRMNHVDAS